MVITDTTAKIIGHAHHVMKSLGKGQRESVYGKALGLAFSKNMIAHRTEICAPYFYLDEVIGYGRVDFILNDVIVELKAIKGPVTEAKDQISRYIKSLNRIENKNYNGLVVNFSQRTGKVEYLFIPAAPTLRPRPTRVVSRFFGNTKK